VEVVLSRAEMDEIDATFPPDVVSGERYPASMLKATNG
jgi:hypothetical protein